jgi:hypothetical protein
MKNKGENPVRNYTKSSKLGDDIGDENGDDSVSTSTKRILIQIQAKPTTWLLFRAVTEESKAQNRHSWILGATDRLGGFSGPNASWLRQSTILNHFIY